MNPKTNPASFRDPAGFIFEHENRILRHINATFKNDYDHLMGSGLYRALVQENLLVEHEESELDQKRFSTAYKIIAPKRIPFISYPYEWCFSQWVAAAHLTLRVQKLALKHGMTLKDASAFNVQFEGKNPIFIDTLSLERQEPNRPWVAYRQFCEHFLAPLALMSLVDSELSKLSVSYPEGIPISLASHLLGPRGKLKIGTLLHLHWHSKVASAKKHSKKPTSRSMSDPEAFIDHLDNVISSLKPKRHQGKWLNYEKTHQYTDTGLTAKMDWVRDRLDHINPRTVWDIGANRGTYSKIAAELGAYVLSMDFEEAVVDANFHSISKQHQARILTLVMNASSPSPSLGWASQERMSLTQRGPADAIMALALAHHLRIQHHISFAMMAEWFSGLSANLIIEFVPKTDPQVLEMTSQRQDIWPDYTQDHFEQSFQKYFSVVTAVTLPNTNRRLYHFKR